MKLVIDDRPVYQALTKVGSAIVNIQIAKINKDEGRMDQAIKLLELSQVILTDLLNQQEV